MPYIDFSFRNIDNKLHAMIKNGLFAILEKRFCFKYNCKCEQKNDLYCMKSFTVVIKLLTKLYLILTSNEILRVITKIVVMTTKCMLISHV